MNFGGDRFGVSPGFHGGLGPPFHGGGFAGGNFVDRRGIFHEGFTPLHAADFLAYEMFQVAKRRSIDRWGWEQFRRVVGEPGFLTADNLDNWNMKLRVSIDHARWYKSVIRHSEEPL